MKKLFLILLVFTINSILYCQYTNITIIGDQGEKFYLFIDGASQNEELQKVVLATINDKRKCSIKIVLEDNKIKPIIKDIKFIPRGNEYTITFVKKKKGRKRVEYKIKKVNNGPIIDDVLHNPTAYSF